MFQPYKTMYGSKNYLRSMLKKIKSIQALDLHFHRNQAHGYYFGASVYHLFRDIVY